MLTEDQQKQNTDIQNQLIQHFQQFEKDLENRGLEELHYCADNYMKMYLIVLNKIQVLIKKTQDALGQVKVPIKDLEIKL